MMEAFGDTFQTPQKREQWAEKAPFLGKWLWVLFWLVIPQMLASLLTSDLFSPQSAFRYLGLLLQVVYLLAYGLVLLKLSAHVARYRTAGICFLVGGIVNILTSVLPAVTSGDGLPLLLGFISLISGVFLMVGEYQEYMGHNELLWDVDVELSDKWHKLWKWYIGCFLALLASIVVILLSPILGLLVTLAAAIGILVVLIVKLVYLYRTAMIFRCWPDGYGSLPKWDRSGDPWDKPDPSSPL